MTAVLILFLTLAPAWDLTTSQTYIYDIYPVNDSEMWCATSGGLFHYSAGNGIDSILVYHEDIPWNDINDMLIDNTGKMWIATNGGGAAVRGESGWAVFTTFEGLPGNGEVYTIENVAGYIWTGSDGGLARGGDQGFVPIDQSSTGGAFKAAEVTDIECQDDTMWLATDRGIYALDLTISPFTPGAWKSFEETTLSLGILGIYADNNGVYGYGSGGIIIREDGDEWRVLLDYSGEADSTVYGLAFSGDTLIAGARGAFRLVDDQWEKWGTGFPSTFYASCVKDACGRIWVGLGSAEINLENFGLGLGYLNEGAWDTLQVPCMACRDCYQIAFDEDRLYMGSHNTGLMAWYPDGGWRSFECDDGMPNTLRTYLAATGYGDGIWAATYHYGMSWIYDGGTYSTEDDTIITFVSDSLELVPPGTTQIVVPLINNQVLMICSQGEGYWVAQEAFWQTPDEPSGIVGFRGNPLQGTMQWGPRFESDGLASPNTRKVFAVGNDSLWIAFKGNDGCQLLVHGGDPSDSSQDEWVPGPGQSFTVASGLPSNQVFCFAREADGSILAGTGAGLARFQDNTFSEVYNITSSVKALEVDDSGRIWCMLSGGIACIENGNTTIYTNLNSEYISTFRELDEFSYFDSENGDIYFSSIIGLWKMHIENDYISVGGSMFYPQPYVSTDGFLHLCGVPADEAVTVDIFSLDGRHLICIEAAGADVWQWDGSINGEPASSGMYMVVVRTESGIVQQARIALVR